MYYNKANVLGCIRGVYVNKRSEVANVFTTFCRKHSNICISFNMQKGSDLPKLYALAWNNTISLRFSCKHLIKPSSYPVFTGMKCMLLVARKYPSTESLLLFHED